MNPLATESHSDALLFSMLALAIVFVFGRLYLRAFKLKALGADDTLIIIALVRTACFFPLKVYST
jgi:hypothetical protein